MSASNGYETGRPIVLAGSGRSGTSWLIDAITLDRNLRPIFEPLHFRNVSNIKRDWWNQYLLADDQHPELHDHFEKVFFGRADAAWYRWMHLRISHRHGPMDSLLRAFALLPNIRPFARQRVVKVIKANLSLMWLQANFPLRLFFITRHPCAVIASRSKMGWRPGFGPWLSQVRLVQDHLQDKLELVNSAVGNVQQGAVIWCLENFLPLQQLQSGQLHAHHARYEDLVNAPDEELRKLLHAVHYPEERIPWLVSKIMSRRVPSTGSLEKWKDQLSAPDIDFIFRAVETFGLLDERVFGATLEVR